MLASAMNDKLKSARAPELLTFDMICDASVGGTMLPAEKLVSIGTATQCMNAPGLLTLTSCTAASAM